MNLFNGSCGEGGYCFISHSHFDIDQVRKIRNELENNGFEPLCFYLKCLTDDDEIEGLIKREIDAREWFVYIDSQNARNSKWVQKERKYIDSLPNKKIMLINLEDRKESVDIAKAIMNNMRVFLSYSSKETSIVQRFKHELLNRDLKVFSALDIDNFEEWNQVLANELSFAAQYGCVVVFISKESINSNQLRDEIYGACSEKALICPVLIGDITIPEWLSCHTSNLKTLTVSGFPTDEEVSIVCDKIAEMLIERFNSIK